MDYVFKKGNREANNARIGFLISILTIALNAFFGYVVMRQILSSVGDFNYGVYKTASSLCGTVSIFDFGISVVAMRYLSSFYSSNDKKGFENYLCVSLIIAGIASVVILIFGFSLFVLIPTIYGQSFSGEQITLCRSIFAILVANMILTIFSNLFCAVISSCRKHYLSSSIKAMNILIKIVLCIAIFKMSSNVLLLAFITAGATLACVLFEIIYILFGLKVRFKLNKFDRALFKDSFIFCGALFFQSIAILLNGNVDNVFIGALISPEAVAIYSFAVLLLNTVEQIGALFTPLTFPKIVDYVDKNNTEKLFTICKNVGRLQVAILLPIVLGFALFGQTFIALWLGESYKDVYYLTLILIVPRFFELIMNSNINILKAKAKLKYRSYILIASMLVNLVITIVGIKLFGYYGAAVGTAVAIILGDIVSSSILYYKLCGINNFKLYREILSRIWIAAVIPFALLAVFGFGFKNKGIFDFVRGLIVFVFMYAVLLFFIGFTKEDRNNIFGSRVEKK